MDLGIRGRVALVSAASRGLGRAAATALAREGVRLTVVARTREAIERAAREMAAETGASVHAVAADVTTREGRERVLAACPNPDILINNAGGPPPGDFRQWSEADWLAAINANMLSPIALIKATVDGMIARRFGRIVNITSAAVKSPIPVLGLSNGARAGLTGFVAGLSRETVRHNVTINNLLPGPFETDRLLGVMRVEAEKAGKDADTYRRDQMALNPAGRFGHPAEFGYACAFLCSAQAGYMTGQNLLLDGGAFRSTF